MTIINGERNIGTVTYVGANTEQNGGMDNNGITKLIGEAGLHGMKIKSNPNNMWIIYRPGHENEANELNTLAEKYGGYFSVHATKADSIRIGQLLGYNQENLWNTTKLLIGYSNTIDPY